VLVALTPLAAGTVVHYGHAPASYACPVTQPIPAKHKLALEDLNPGDLVRMYGMVVGEVTQPIPCGGLLSTRNVRHRADPYSATRHPVSFALPDASAWLGRTFMGYHRAGKRWKKNLATAARIIPIASMCGAWCISGQAAMGPAQTMRVQRHNRIAFFLVSTAFDF
jgi:hypothetical protein